MSSFRFRPATDADAETVVELVSALDVAMLGSTDYSLADLHDEWSEILPEDRYLVEAAGMVVGYGTVEQNPQHGQSDGYVHPEHFGRGVGSFLVGELEQLLARRGATRVQNAALVVDTRAQELLRAHGYEEIRRFWHMRIELEDEPPAPQWPGGLTVSRFDPADAAVFHAALETAFADHWQHEPEPFEKWRETTLERDDFSPELWAVVRDGDEIVAGTVCRPERLGVPWIARLFTRREWRRRGLGEALLYDAFGTFWQLGKRTVGLGVDAQSDTGAQRLYERAGMHVHWGAVVFEKEVG
jgi:ribosomal protein S18 acetylase RimI-like enzyme